MNREMCYSCFLPKEHCWCSLVEPMDTRTKFVFLMHPKEYKHIKCGTGRLTHLCLKNSEIFMGVCFDENPLVQALINDPDNIPVVLFPGQNAIDVGHNEHFKEQSSSKRLVIFLIDATWRLAKRIYKQSPSLQKLVRLKISPAEKSRFVIKKQPRDYCLSTLEATHELLLMLEKNGLDTYKNPRQLLDFFLRMQERQIEYMVDPDRKGYRLKNSGDQWKKTIEQKRNALEKQTNNT